MSHSVTLLSPATAKLRGRSLLTFERIGSRLVQFGRRNWRKMLVVLATLTLLHTGCNLYASFLLNRELAEIRLRGEAVTIAEMAPPPISPGMNAALYYRKATASLHLSREESSPGAQLWKPGPTSPESAKVLLKNQRAVALAIQGGFQESADFGLNWHVQPYAITFPYYAEVRRLSRLVSLDAQQRAERGDTEGALHDVRAIMGMANHVSGDPIYIGFLMGRAISAIAHQTLAQVLMTTKVNRTQAVNFESSLPAADWSQTLRRSMQGERTLGIAVFETVQRGKFAQRETGASDDLATRLISHLTIWYWQPWFKLDEVYTLRHWKRIIGSMTPVRLPAANNVSDEESMFAETPRYAIMTRLTMPVFSKATKTLDYFEVEARQREIALALAGYRTVYGTYPPDLQTAAAYWGHPFALDLYRHQPMLYHRTGRTFVLYSAGPNGKDDGGKGPRGLDRHRVVYKKGMAEDDLAWGPGDRQ